MFDGKMKAVTFSYDDGVLQDKRLIEILNKYGLKCTFNLNSGFFGKAGSLIRDDVTVAHCKPLAREVHDIYEGHEIVPLQFLKFMLPDPATLGPRTVGKTNIGCIFKGKKDGKEKKYYLYNVCDHQECYKEVGSQAISYTTGVPAMIGAMLIMNGTWNRPGVNNIEEFDPDPFMDALNKWGLPWIEDFDPVEVE